MKKPIKSTKTLGTKPDDKPTHTHAHTHMHWHSHPPLPVMLTTHTHTFFFMPLPLWMKKWDWPLGIKMGTQTRQVVQKQGIAAKSAYNFHSLILLLNVCLILKFASWNVTSVAQYYYRCDDLYKKQIYFSLVLRLSSKIDWIKTRFNVAIIGVPW